MKVIGIDPSLTGTGVIALSNGKIVARQLIKTKPTGDNKYLELCRLRTIRDCIILDEVDLVVMEGLAFMARNTTALVQLAGLNYLIRDRLLERDIPFVIVAPTTLKKFLTGHGNAPKDQIMMEVYKRYHVSITDNNIADAYVLARIGQALTSNIKLTSYQKEVVELLKPQIQNGKNSKKRN